MDGAARGGVHCDAVPGRHPLRRLPIAPDGMWYAQDAAGVWRAMRPNSLYFACRPWLQAWPPAGSGFLALPRDGWRTLPEHSSPRILHGSPDGALYIKDRSGVWWVWEVSEIRRRELESWVLLRQRIGPDKRRAAPG